MSDVIDRQSAIDAIQAAYIYTDGGEDKNAVWTNVGLTNALHIMQDLPSAQPTHDCDTCRYNHLEWDEEPCDSCTAGGENNHWKPSAQPEIIRCKDCKYYRPMIDQDDLCDYRGMQVFPDDYCSRAEPYKGEQE